jgi:hypothetical protein
MGMFDDWGLSDLFSGLFGGDGGGGGPDLGAIEQTPLPDLPGYTPGGIEDPSLPMPPPAPPGDPGSAGGKSWFGQATDALGGGRGLASLAGLGLGAGLSASGNTAAANTASDAAVRAAQIQADAQAQARAAYQKNALAGIDAVNTGVNNYAATINPLLTPNPIMLPQYRGLTTSQQIGLADLDRNNKATLAASGLRGAGRAGIGTVMDSESRYIANAQDGNDRQRLQAMQQAQQTANSARTGLAGVYAGQGSTIANIETGIGNNASGSLATTGNNTAAAVNTVGQTQAGATLANTQLAGGALGSIGATLARASKADKADAYGPV